jgi:hypothetical protein
MMNRAYCVSVLAMGGVAWSVFASTVTDTRFEIEQALREMSAACVAGDSDGYLAHVASADHEFLNEQKYFAKDLKKKPAKECSFTIGELKEIGSDEARGPLTIEWTMPNAKARSISFDVSFVHDDGQWKYAGEVWERDESPGVIVMHDPGLSELAVRVVQAFNEIRPHVEEGFQLADKPLAKKTQKVKLYGTMKHLQASICLSYSDGLSGWNEPGESVKILTRATTGVSALRPLLAHEYGHVATFELGPKASSMPWWILEGVAELSAEEWGRKPDGVVKVWAENGRLAKWDDLADFETVEGKWRGHVYTQGHHMLGYISEKFGREMRVKWLTALAEGKSLDDASLEAMNLNFGELDAQWRASLPAFKLADDGKAAEKEEQVPEKGPDAPK